METATCGAVRKATKKNGFSASAPPPYASRIIKPSALFSDTKALLSQGDAHATVSENLESIGPENVFAKPSTSSIADILAIFRRRYLVEADLIKALVVLVKKRSPTASLDRVLYFQGKGVVPC